MSHTAIAACLPVVLLAAGCGSPNAMTPASAAAKTTTVEATGAPAAHAAKGLRLSWADNMLSVIDPSLPGGRIEIWYLEAFCRSGSTSREWAQTVIPHRTVKVAESPDGKWLKLRSVIEEGEVEAGVEALHEIRAGEDSVDFHVEATNHGGAAADVAWVQPCLRVGEFTARGQEDYAARCFIFVDGVLTTLDRTERREEALYRGGQVYVPNGIDPGDVNPRPISSDVPSNGLIGCFSKDDRRILATAWEPYQELFQGVIVCIHADFRLGGLAPGETKTARGKLYLVENDADALLERYKRDFGE